MDKLAALAAAFGIAPGYHDFWGGYHATSDATRRDLLVAMRLPPERIASDPDGLLAEYATELATQAPPSASAARCYRPAPLAAGGRLWGLTVQLYGVRSRRNWGIGDFTDLANLLAFTAAAGGHLVGINPLHALFPERPQLVSPYSPSHRAFLNVLYLDIEAVPELALCAPAQRRLASADFQARLAALRDSPHVDYAGVAAAKFALLPLLFETFRRTGGARAAAFAEWRAQQGETLELFTRFEALQEYFFRRDPHVWGWPAWPAAYHDPRAPAVADFAQTHADAVTYHAWLQWLADTQLAAAAARARRLGMIIGLYHDLAVGANPGGAEVWINQPVFADGAYTGAPPDELNLLGQDWGLPPFIPHRLSAANYAPLRTIIRANMRHAGALRIDHVMGLQRLFWVPRDMPASEGAYVDYAFAAQLDLLAEESLRNTCLVIGEDLGTVPPGFRERLAEAGAFSYHPLLFERYPDGQFRLPGEIPAQALVAVSTHDLPPLAGFWIGNDLAVRTRLMLFPNEAVRQRLVTERDWDRGRLLWALERTGLLPPGVSKDPAAQPELTHAVSAAIHAFLARSPAQLMVIQPEDLFGLADQANVPGTTEAQQPNWQRKLPVPLEDWGSDARIGLIFDAVRRERAR